MQIYKYVLALIPLSLVSFDAYSYSATAHSLSSEVTNSQATAIANELLTHSILVIASAGAIINQVTVKGSYTLDYRDYLNKLDLNEIFLKISGMTFSGAIIKMSISANFSNGDCNNPIITYKVASGSSVSLDVAIKKYITEQSVQFIRDNFIKNTLLSQYCDNLET